MQFLARLRHSYAAVDPGRLRIKNATVVSLGMVLSALGALTVVNVLGGPAPLLTIGIILGMLLGQIPHAPTARGRCLTTALMYIPVAVAATVATLLADYRALQIVILVIVVGVGTWVRRYGPRATAMGFGAFFGFFFMLLMKLSIADLPYFLLVAAIAAASQTAMRAILISAKPQKQIQLLLRELRSASANALAAAVTIRPDDHSEQKMRTRLARIDTVSLAITNWQQEFTTEKHIRCEETTFAALLLDARMDTEQAVQELIHPDDHVVLTKNKTHHRDLEVAAAINDLKIILNNDSHSSAVAEAAKRTSARYQMMDTHASNHVLIGRLSRAALAHSALRKVDLTHELSTSNEAPLQALEAQSAPQPSGVTATKPAFWDWRNWQQNTRMTIQIMVAVALATIVGETISASRWYWAVLSVFVVFIGSTTRGGILTRAYRRIVGTVFGLAIGTLLVVLAHNDKTIIITITILSAFLMMYLGPIKYSYQSFFLSAMLVGLYALLGELNPNVLELRIVETVAGCAIGVVCAYLIFSTGSRPTLISHIGSYFDALRTLLNTASTAILTPAQGKEVLHAVRSFDSVLADVDSFTAGMSTAFMLPQRTPHEPNIHLFYVCARASEQFAQSAITLTNSNPNITLQGDAAVALQTAIAHVTQSADQAQASFNGHQQPIASNDTTVLDLVARLPYEVLSPQVTALVNLSRVNWVLLQIIQRNAGAHAA